MATVDELRYHIVGSLALLEFLKAKRGEIPEASITEYRKSVEPEVAAFEAGIIHAERKRILDAFVAKFNMGGRLHIIIPTSILEEAK